MSNKNKFAFGKIRAWSFLILKPALPFPTKAWRVKLLSKNIPFILQKENFQVILDAIKNNQFHIINSLWHWSLILWIIASLMSQWFSEVSGRNDIFYSITSNSEF